MNLYWNQHSASRLIPKHTLRRDFWNWYLWECAGRLAEEDGIVLRAPGRMGLPAPHSITVQSWYVSLCRFGGAKRDRTADLLVANEALSQLSYSPTMAGNTSFSLAAHHLIRKVASLLPPGPDYARTEAASASSRSLTCFCGTCPWARSAEPPPRSPRPASASFSKLPA